MVTDRDIVCKGLAEDSFDARRATARDVMTPGIHCCREDDDLAKAVRHMEELKVRRLPVINKSYVICLFGFIIWVGLIISWVFFHGVQPPIASG